MTTSDLYSLYHHQTEETRWPNRTGTPQQETWRSSTWLLQFIQVMNDQYWNPLGVGVMWLMANAINHPQNHHFYMAGFWTVTIFRGGLWHCSTHITPILGFTSILEHPSKNWLHLREIAAPSQRPPRPQLRRQQCCRSWRRRWSTCQRTSMALFATGSPMISYENWVRSVWFMEISHDSSYFWQFQKNNGFSQASNVDSHHFHVPHHLFADLLLDWECTSWCPQSCER